MNTTGGNNELISAFVDDELDVDQHDSLIKSLRTVSSARTWDEYHLIGDALRSSEAACFSTRSITSIVMAGLAAEPIHLKSEKCSKLPPMREISASSKLSGRFGRTAVPGAALAAMVILGLTLSSSGSHLMSFGAGTENVVLSPVSQVQNVTAISDSEIDEYLSAHQRLSPSMYTSTHFAGSSNVASE